VPTQPVLPVGIDAQEKAAVLGAEHDGLEQPEAPVIANSVTRKIGCKFDIKRAICNLRAVFQARRTGERERYIDIRCQR
jgi:hypothetical protein